MRNRGREGSSLGGTLLAVTILATLAAGLASLCVNHLRLSNRSDVSLNASNLARSVVAAGIAKVLKNEAFGTAADGGPTEVTVTTPNGTGFLTFSQATARTRGVDYSTNNVAGSTTVLGAGGRSIAANAVHLVGYGTSGGLTRKIDAVLVIPSFPWAVASGGEITINAGAVVGSVPPNVWPPTLADLLPADVVSNATTSQAIYLSSGSHVLGDVETPGSVVKQDASARVDGSIRQGAQSISLPTLDPNRFDPLALNMTYDDLDTTLGPSSTSLNLTGTSRRTSDLTVNGGLTLDGAQMFVDGDLMVRGPIVGTGVLVVTGDITVDSGMTLNGATDIAVISGGHVNLVGAGPASSAIRGTFYAKLGVTADDITVVGTMIAPDPSATIRLTNARVFGQQVASNTPGTAGTSSTTTNTSTPGTASTTTTTNPNTGNTSPTTPTTPTNSTTTTTPTTGSSSSTTTTTTNSGSGGGRWSLGGIRTPLNTFASRDNLGDGGLGGTTTTTTTNPGNPGGTTTTNPGGTTPGNPGGNPGGNVGGTVPGSPGTGNNSTTTTTTGGATGGSTTVSANPGNPDSSFLPLKDRIRVHSWFES